MEFTDSQMTKINELGQARWEAIRRLSEVCEVLMEHRESDLEDVVVFLAKIVVDKDKPYRKFQMSLHNEHCECTKEEESEVKS